MDQDPPEITRRQKRENKAAVFQLRQEWMRLPGSSRLLPPQDAVTVLRHQPFPQMPSETGYPSNYDTQMAQYHATVQQSMHAQSQALQQYQQTMQHSFRMHQTPQYNTSAFVNQPAPPLPNLIQNQLATQYQQVYQVSTTGFSFNYDAQMAQYQEIMQQYQATMNQSFQNFWAPQYPTNAFAYQPTLPVPVVYNPPPIRWHSAKAHTDATVISPSNPVKETSESPEAVPGLPTKPSISAKKTSRSPEAALEFPVKASTSAEKTSHRSKAVHELPTKVSSPVKATSHQSKAVRKLHAKPSTPNEETSQQPTARTMARFVSPPRETSKQIPKRKHVDMLSDSKQRAKKVAKTSTLQEFMTDRPRRQPHIPGIYRENPAFLSSDNDDDYEDDEDFSFGE
ncbi:MAG: hypothetical protein Q9195_000821 [Heterodermia aff. obscurata]